MNAAPVAAPASTYLSTWSSFYTITGSAAAALVGLMFVVITLVTGSERPRRSSDGISTFSTPTVTHFGTALFVSAVLSAPWQSLIYASIIVGIGGLCGVVYIFHIMHRTRRLTTYTPDLEDWTWYTALPLLGYGAIFAGAIGTFGAPRIALFPIAGGALLLIFIGIRNAWDVVTFLAIGGNDEAQS